MSRFACNTPGGASPQGLGRVWFCAHAEDHSTYFDPICDELFAAARCAVYYDTDPATTFAEGELYEALSEINLFVIPITSRFLLTENRARCEELAYAQKNHIPILPLLQEAGLESDFNRLCGEIQFLDKNDTDVTAIPYAEKLSRFLSSVLLKDEQAAEVRAAFDAYVFLSYRKKDRRYAQELMRLIHNRDFCRDVAIWYDEFLTPGENFNDAIAGALARCDLFALAVTPNLVCEKNYVQTTEYPAAHRAGKRILAAELLPTDRAALRAQYEDIPTPIDPRTDGGLTEALRQALSGLSLRHREGDPRQDFLIGLAYLGGIDVEVDRERAVALITLAGEAGLTEAIGKLVSMYRAGEGVPRDQDRAILWQRRLVERLSALFANDPSEERARRVTDEHGELYDMLYEAHRYREAVEETNSLLAFASSTEDYPFFFAVRSHAHRRIGNIELTEGRFEEAERRYRLALSEAERIPEDENATSKKNCYLQLYIKLGDLARERRELQQAKEYFEKALAILSSHSRGGRSRSILLGRLGTTAMKLGNHEEAQAYYEEALEIDLAALREQATPLAKRDLSISYDRLGNLARARLRQKRAYEYYSKALALDREYAEDTGTVSGVRAVSLSLLRVGSVAFDLEDYDAAEAAFTECLTIRRRILATAPTLEATRDLVSALSWLGRVAAKRTEWAKAEAYFKEELELNLALASKSPIPEVIRDLGISCQRLASLARGLGKHREAMAYLKKSETIDAMLLDMSRTVDAMRDMSVTYDLICSLAWKMKDYATAQEYAERECALDREILSITDSPAARSDLSTSCIRLGDIKAHLGLHGEAIEYYDEAVALCLDIYAKNPSFYTRRELSSACSNRAYAARELGDHRGARDYYARCAALWHESFSERPSASTAGSLVDALFRMAQDEVALSRLPQALSVYRRAYDVAVKMRQMKDDTEAQCRAARAQERIGYLSLRLDEREAAREAYTAARDILTPLVEEHPELTSYTTLLAAVKRELADL